MQMSRFEAEKFCAKLKLKFGMTPSLVETFLNGVSVPLGLVSMIILPCLNLMYVCF
jgi:hypothetical protein